MVTYQGIFSKLVQLVSFLTVFLDYQLFHASNVHLYFFPSCLDVSPPLQSFSTGFYDPRVFIFGAFVLCVGELVVDFLCDEFNVFVR